MNKIYWDEGNGIVTTEPKFAPIVRGQDIYIETYSLANSEKTISIAYTQETKENENLYWFRRNILNNHGLDYSDLGKLVNFKVPSNVYDRLVKTYNSFISEAGGKQ